MRDSEIEPGYLSHERLSPEEIASIETALRSASPIRARRRPVRWLGLAAAAAMVATAVFVVTQFPSQPIDDADEVHGGHILTHSSQGKTVKKRGRSSSGDQRRAVFSSS